MVGEGGFDLEGGDVLAGAADDVLAPVDEVQLPVRPAPHGVTGVEPAAAPGFLGGGFVLVVAREEAFPRIRTFLPHQQFAAFFLELDFESVRRKTNTSGPY